MLKCDIINDMKRSILFLFAVFLFSASFASAAPASLGFSMDGAVVLDSDAKTIYLITANERRGFPSAAVFFSHGYEFKDVVPIKQMDYTKTEGKHMVYREGTLVKGSAPIVYIISEGVKRPFVSADVFLGLGYSFGNIVFDEGSVLGTIPTGTEIYSANISHPAGTLVNHNGTIYVMDTSARIGIPSLEVFNSHGYEFKDVVTASAAYDNTMPSEKLLAARSQVAPAEPPPIPPAGPTPPPPAPQNAAPSPAAVTGYTGVYPKTSETYTFVATDQEGDDIAYSVDWGDGGPHTVPTMNLASGSSFSAAHDWTYIGDYTIKVTATDTKGATSTKLFPIKVNSDPSLFGPAITVLTPNGGETLTQGKPYDITWRRNWSPPQSFGRVDIYYQKGGLNQSVRLGAEGTSYSWVPIDITGGSNFKISIVSQGNSGGQGIVMSDESDNTFTISEVKGANTQ